MWFEPKRLWSSINTLAAYYTLTDYLWRHQMDDRPRDSLSLSLSFSLSLSLSLWL